MTSKRALELIKKEKKRLEWFKKNVINVLMMNIMNNKEAQNIILNHIDDLDLIFDEELQKALSKIDKDLKVLEIFKKYLLPLRISLVLMKIIV